MAVATRAATPARYELARDERAAALDGDVQRSAALEDVIECRPEADEERTAEHGRLAEARDLDARREVHPLREQRPDRREQEVAVRADAAAEDDQLDVA